MIPPKPARCHRRALTARPLAGPIPHLGPILVQGYASCSLDRGPTRPLRSCRIAARRPLRMLGESAPMLAQIANLILGRQSSRSFCSSSNRRAWPVPPPRPGVCRRLWVAVENVFDSLRCPETPPDLVRRERRGHRFSLLLTPLPRQAVRRYLRPCAGEHQIVPCPKRHATSSAMQ